MNKTKVIQFPGVLLILFAFPGLMAQPQRGPGIGSPQPNNNNTITFRLKTPVAKYGKQENIFNATCTKTI